MTWLSKFFSPSERRSARRHQSPPLLAFYWDGELPTPHAVPDISNTGMFVKTDAHWTESSMLRVTLQTQSEDPQKPGESITVQCRIVRTEEDGAGMAIMLAEEGKSGRPNSGLLATRKEFKKFLSRLGTATTESPAPETNQTTAQDNPSSQSAEHDPQENK